MTRRTRKTSKQEKGITLIALIVTIIVLLILAGVTINLAVNNQGIFNKAKTATRAYKNATEDERTGLDEADKEIAKYMPGGSETTGNDPLKNTDRTIDDLNKDEGDSNKDGVVDTKDDLRGFYIDLNNDGNLDTTNDGVIYGDLLTGGKGVYWCATTEGMYDDIDSYLASLTDKTDDEKKTMKEEYNSATGFDKIDLSWQYAIKSGIAEVEKYTIPTKSTLSTYEIIKDSNGNIKKFDGPFGSRGMLQRKTAVTNGDRFYVMALGDIDNNGHTWYKNAVGKMNDYSTYTSTEFGQGKENTRKMIARGNNNGKDPYDSNNTSDYGALSDSDVWKAIQSATSNNGSGSSSSSGSGSEKVPGGTVAFETTKKDYKFSTEPYIKIEGTEPSYKIDKTGGEAATTSLVAKGWFVPSRDEWNAFGAFFKVGGPGSSDGLDGNTYTFTDYYDFNNVYKLSPWCWASSQDNSNKAYIVNFNYGDSGDGNLVNYIGRVRLGSTF